MSKSKTNADEKLYSELDDLFNRLSSQSDNDTLNDKHILAKTNELVQCMKKLERKALYEKILFRLGCLLLVIGLGILFWSSIRIYVIYLIRFAFVYLDAVFDLSLIYNSKCLLTNPNYVPEPRIKLEMCKYTCGVNNREKFLKTFMYGTNLNRETFKEIVYESNIPILINYSISSDAEIKNTKSITNNYLKDMMSDDDFCLFESADFDASPLSFFDKIFDNKLKTYSAMWENCGRKASKAFKRLYKRPDFFPLSFEIAAQNWIFVSNKFKHNIYIKVPISQRVVLFNQIKGQSEVKLISDNCKTICKEKRVIVKKGQILTFTDMWRVEFMPDQHKENIVVALLSG